jgi:predicted amidohydrolase
MKFLENLVLFIVSERLGYRDKLREFERASRMVFLSSHLLKKRVDVCAGFVALWVSIWGLLVSPVCGGEHVTNRSPDRIVKICVLQAGTEHSKNGNPGFEANFTLFADLARKAAVEKPNLIVFPEYPISGWPYPSGERINNLAEAIPGDGPWYRRFVALAQEIKVPILGSHLARHDGKLYGCAFLLNASGECVGTYHKVHANLGEQTWWGWSQGKEFKVLELDGVKYGVSICADMWFPESVRCCELLGADVVLHQSIGDDMSHLIPARAFDSFLPIVCAINNGGSYAVDDLGKMIGKKVADESATWQIYDVRPFQVRKDRKYGGQWIPELGHRNLRNVDAYRILTDPKTRPRWTEVFQGNDGESQTEAQLRARFHGRWDAHDPANETATPQTKLTIDGSKFVTNGHPRFLVGLSYYSGAGAERAAVLRDLDEAQKLGFNWIRVWATWNLFNHDVSAFDVEGQVREPYHSQLCWLVEECDRRGMVVDVTLERGKGRVSPGVRDLAAHLAAAKDLTESLRQHRNWYLDLANERQVMDYRFVSIEELRTLRNAVKQIDSQRLVTASHGHDLSDAELKDLIETVGVDFIAPHRPREKTSPLTTESKTKDYLKLMQAAGRIVPVLYQEPLRRGYLSGWEPTAEDFANDLHGAIQGGAAGWCFHNGDQRDRCDGKPGRAFDLRSQGLFAQFDNLDRQILAAVVKEIPRQKP